MPNVINIYIIFNKYTYYMSAYDTCAASPPFLKEGQGWFVLFIKLTLFTYFTIKGVPRLYTALPGKYSQDFIFLA